jgi:hypothetical protein
MPFRRLPGRIDRSARAAVASIQAAFPINTSAFVQALTGCHVYGISAWDLKLEKTKENLIVAPQITADDLEVAAFRLTKGRRRSTLGCARPSYLGNLGSNRFGTQIISVRSRRMMVPVKSR